MTINFTPTELQSQSSQQNQLIVIQEMDYYGNGSERKCHADWLSLCWTTDECSWQTFLVKYFILKQRTSDLFQVMGEIPIALEVFTARPRICGDCADARRSP